MGLIKKVYTLAKRLSLWYHIVWKASNDFHIPFRIKLKYALLGFSPNEYIWFDLKHNNRKEYISNYERTLSREIDGEYKVVLDDKLLFEEIFHSYFRTPKIYAWISKGAIYGLCDYGVTQENIIPFLEKIGKSVLKSEKGANGKDVYVIEALGNGDFLVNGESKTSNDIYNYFRKNTAILCEYIRQSKFSSSLYPESTNTLRIICAKEKGESKAEIIKAAQRIGNICSKPVDNVSAGAIVCPVDICTGELGAGTIAKGHIEQNNKFFDTHPDTGTQLKGRSVPNWNKLKDQIVEVTNQFPYLNIVAWDVLLTDDGFCVLEGNASSGCVMFQTEHGIRNEKVGDIYRSYGIIR